MEEFCSIAATIRTRHNKNIDTLTQNTSDYGIHTSSSSSDRTAEDTNTTPMVFLSNSQNVIITYSWIQESDIDITETDRTEEELLDRSAREEEEEQIFESAKFHCTVTFPERISE